MCIAKHSCSSQTPTKGSESTPHVANPLVLCIARVLKQSPGPAKGREWSGLSISHGPRIIKYQEKDARPSPNLQRESLGTRLVNPSDINHVSTLGDTGQCWVNSVSTSQERKGGRGALANVSKQLSTHSLNQPKIFLVVGRSKTLGLVGPN